jgi:hypothetical protein
MGLPILTGYMIGGLADSQLKAIAMLKFYMLIYLTLPAVTVFLPRSGTPSSTSCRITGCGRPLKKCSSVSWAGRTSGFRA